MVAIGSVERYIQEARAQGCPRDQVENFIRFGQVLQPKQLRASALARECDLPNGPQFLLFGGARGPGKSHWAVVQSGIDDCQRCPGLKVLLLRKVAKAGKEGFDDIRIRTLSAVPHRYASIKGILHFANGSRIIIGHFQNEKDIDAYLGLEYDLIIVEEAGTLTKEKIKNIRTCLRTSKPNWRPRMYLTTNPGGVGHAYLKKWFVTPHKLGKEAGTDSRYVPATVDDNLMINPEYVTTNLDTLSGWQKKAWRYGDWDIMAGQFFINWFEAVHVRKSTDVVSGAEFFLSLDHGWTHPTACHLGMRYDGDNFVIDEYGGRRRQVSDHVAGIEAMLARNGLTLANIKRKVAGHDIWSKHDEERHTADKYKELGIEWDKAQIDRINGASNMVSLLGEPMDENGDPLPDEDPKRPRLFVYERCTNLIEQMPAMVHDPHRPDDVLKVDCDDEGEGGDDYYDSGRMLLMEMSPNKLGWAQNPDSLREIIEAVQKSA